MDVTRRMQRDGIPYTRANWIRANWGSNPDFGPEGWTHEHEAELPADLRRAAS